MVNASNTSWLSTDLEETDDFTLESSTVRVGNRKAASLERFHSQRRHSRRSTPSSKSGARRRLRKPMGI